MAFDYPVTLDLEGASCVLVGGGPRGLEQLTALLRARARVAVISERPSGGMSAQCQAFNIPLLARAPTPDDLDGARLVLVTGEDACDVAALHAAARERGVLFASLVDDDHRDFATPATVQRGWLAVTASTGGRAPALAERVVRNLEAALPHEVTALLEVVAQVGRRADGPAAWARALEDLDGLLAMLRDGREHAAERAIVDALERANAGA